MAADTDLTLFYRFADLKTLEPWNGLGPTLGITRTTERRVYGELGLLQTVPTGVAGFDHNPVTGESLGLFIEEARTNICLRSEDLSNAAWVVSNVTKGSTSVTAPDGTANTNVRLTASSGNGTCLQTVTSSSANRSYAVFMKRVTGTGNIQLTTDNGATWVTKTLTADWLRFDVQKTSITNPVCGVRIVTSGDAIDFFGNDLQVGNFQTSYIPTVGSSVTRNADVVRTTDVSWMNFDEGTFYSVATANEVVINARVFTSSAGGTDYVSQFISQADGTGNYIVRAGGVTVVQLTTASAWVAGAAVSQASAYKVNDFESYVEGARSGSGDQAGAVPADATALAIGKWDSDIQFFNGHIAQIRDYNVRKDNQFLEDLSNGLIIEHLRPRGGGRFLILEDPTPVATRRRIRPQLSPPRPILEPEPSALYTAVRGATARVTRAKSKQSRTDKILKQTGITATELEKILR